MTDQPAFNFSDVEVLTFDCYGTLVDWEAGLLAGMRRVLGDAAASTPDDTLLEGYAAAEAEAERGPWIPYRQVLTVALTGVCRALGVQPTSAQAAEFADSVGDWPLFPDSVAALERLGARYELGVITNCDDDLFERSHKRLGHPFRRVVTAEQVRSYKPARRGFEVALERIGRPRERILHVAQSLYHDHVPAQAMGLATAWINRRHDRPGAGATPVAEAAPNVTAPDMASFADLALAGRRRRGDPSS